MLRCAAPLVLLAVCACACACAPADPAPRPVSSDAAPRAIGPYSQAIDAGRFVFLAGQIAIDPATNQLVDADIRVQTERVLRNLEAVLAAAGLRMEHVVQTTVYMTDLSEFPAMNEVYAQFFPRNPPARATVQVAALPRGARVEIAAVAAR
jgi:2-iminobutanoate/2-iminopropanoate deaminase